MEIAIVLFVVMVLLVIAEPRFASAMRTLIYFVTFVSLGIVGYTAVQVGTDNDATYQLMISILGYGAVLAVILTFAGMFHTPLARVIDWAWPSSHRRLPLPSFMHRRQPDPNGPSLVATRAMVSNSTVEVSLLSPLRRPESAYVIRCQDDIKDSMAEDIETKCRLALQNNSVSSVILYINSGGGKTHAMYRIRRAVQELNATKPVSVIAQGQAASAAITLLTCVPIEQRFAYGDTLFMWHTASGSDRVQVRMANEHLVEMLVNETRISGSSLKRLVDSKQNYWFTAQQAHELGVIGTIL